MNKNIIFASIAFMGVAFAQVSPTFLWDATTDIQVCAAIVYACRGALRAAPIV